jgi:acyl-[acyl-carrier-protein] desaturase
MIYTSFQERATKISHQNVGKIAQLQGDINLAKICQKISGDEARHEAFYTKMMGEVMNHDPAGGIIEFKNVMKKTIAMPGRLMEPGSRQDLFDQFAAVSQLAGTYTVQNYADIIAHLVTTWRVGERSVSGAAAEAQEYLCLLAKRYDSVINFTKIKLSERLPSPFAWIFDRSI